MGDDTKQRTVHGVWTIRLISTFVMLYLLFSLVSPLFLKEGKAPRKLETPDIILISLVLLFNSGILSRLENLGVSQDKGFTANFKIGKDEVSLENLGATITDRLRELEVSIESVKTQQVKPEVGEIKSESTEDAEIPSALEKILKDNVYKMLESNLWLGRYVETLAKNISVSEETMLKFCRSRDDIGLFKDGGRWVAALQERLDARKRN